MSHPPRSAGSQAPATGLGACPIPPAARRLALSLPQPPSSPLSAGSLCSPGPGSSPALSIPVVPGRCHLATFPQQPLLRPGCRGLHPGGSSYLGSQALPGTVHPETALPAPSKKSRRCFHCSGKFLARLMFFFSFWPSPVSFSTFVICSTLLPYKHQCLLAGLGDTLSPQTVTPASRRG